MKNCIPIVRPGDLANLDLSPEEKRWFLVVLRVLQEDGLSRTDAYELIGRAFYVSDQNRSASLREIVNALYENSRARHYPIWKDCRIVRAMGAGIAQGLHPENAISDALVAQDYSSGICNCL